MQELLNSPMPAWVLMWLITASIFFVGKLIILNLSRQKLKGWRLFAFIFLWVGMDEKEWVQNNNRATFKQHSLLVILLKMSFGGILLWLVARQLADPIFGGWCGMIGLIFLLHFGLFDLGTIFWKKLGVSVRPIMENPAGAISLTDFWGRRWNIAFHDLAHIFIFKPLVMKYGAKVALCFSFIFSGILHDLLISVPAGAGYGLPTIYFVLQAFGILLERRIFRGINSTEKAFVRWLFTHSFTIIPAYILFHPPFVKNVMIPFFQAIGALP